MEILILFGLILMNGVFAMSEMAVVSARKARLQHLADEGKRGAKVALRLAQHPSSFLATIQVGITVIGITSGAFGEAKLTRGLSEWLSQWAVLDRHSEAIAVTIVITGITLAALIFGELVPKRLALLDPERVASLVAGPMQALSRVAYPLVRALGAVTDGILRLLGLRATGESPVTEEEIKVLMEQGAEAGVFEAHEQQLVSRVFRLDELRVTGVMTPAATSSTSTSRSRSRRTCAASSPGTTRGSRSCAAVSVTWPASCSRRRCSRSRSPAGRWSSRASPRRCSCPRRSPSWTWWRSSSSIARRWRWS